MRCEKKNSLIEELNTNFDYLKEVDCFCKCKQPEEPNKFMQFRIYGSNPLPQTARGGPAVSAEEREVLIADLNCGDNRGKIVFPNKTIFAPVCTKYSKIVEDSFRVNNIDIYDVRETKNSVGFYDISIQFEILFNLRFYDKNMQPLKMTYVSSAVDQLNQPAEYCVGNTTNRVVMTSQNKGIYKSINNQIDKSRTVTQIPPMLAVQEEVLDSLACRIIYEYNSVIYGGIMEQPSMIATTIPGMASMQADGAPYVVVRVSPMGGTVDVKTDRSCCSDVTDCIYEEPFTCTFINFYLSGEVETVRIE